MTEPTASTMPNASASSGVTRPRGMGRLAVRCMQASMSASYHMLSAPEAPAPTAMHSSAMKREHGVQVSGRQHHADERREDHERHHPRLHQGEVVADASARALGGAQRSSQIVLRFSHIAFANVMPAQAGIHAS